MIYDKVKAVNSPQLQFVDNNNVMLHSHHFLTWVLSVLTALILSHWW
jgi:hypothetical protein